MWESVSHSRGSYEEALAVAFPSYQIIHSKWGCGSLDWYSTMTWLKSLVKMTGGTKIIKCYGIGAKCVISGATHSL